MVQHTYTRNLDFSQNIFTAKHPFSLWALAEELTLLGSEHFKVETASRTWHCKQPLLYLWFC